MSDFDTANKDHMICPYCGLHSAILLGSKYEICQRCGKPFEIKIILDENSTPLPNEAGYFPNCRITTKTILGVT